MARRSGSVVAAGVLVALLVVLLVVVLLVVVLRAGILSDDPDLPDARSLCDVGRSNDQGVVGHDLAASARLSGGEVLFVFGDTLLGEIREGRRRTGGLVSSSAAVLPAGSDICEEPLEYLTDDEGEVRELLPAPPVEGTTYWPVDVAVAEGRVWMLYRWVERTGDGPLELRIRGTGLAVADEDDLVWEPVDDLLVEGSEPLPTAVVEDGGEVVALVCDGGGGDAGDECRLRALDTGAGELGDPLDVPPVDLAAAEMSLDRLPAADGGAWRVSAMPDLRCRLEVAVLVDGSWSSEPVLAPDVDDRLCYAGRIQEPFSDGDEVVATWVDGGGPLEEQGGDADTYWPHAEAIDLSEE